MRVSFLVDGLNDCSGAARCGVVQKSNDLNELESDEPINFHDGLNLMRGAAWPTDADE